MHENLGTGETARHGVARETLPIAVHFSGPSNEAFSAIFTGDTPVCSRTLPDLSPRFLWSNLARKTLNLVLRVGALLLSLRSFAWCFGFSCFQRFRCRLTTLSLWLEQFGSAPSDLGLATLYIVVN